MESWSEIALDSRRAAAKLALDGHFRSAVSRAYYAAYALAAARLKAEGETFKSDRDGPSHAGLSQRLKHALRPSVGEARRAQAGNSIRRLYDGRLEADYQPNATFDLQRARQALRDLEVVRRILEPDDD